MDWLSVERRVLDPINSGRHGASLNVPSRCRAPREVDYSTIPRRGTVSKIDPATATVTVGWNPRTVAFDGSNIWVANGSGTVSRIIPF
jgi:DNA-binding beta-propeller fold protein YncE